jgi:hypothetical protein
VGSACGLKDTLPKFSLGTCIEEREQILFDLQILDDRLDHQISLLYRCTPDPTSE